VRREAPHANVCAACPELESTEGRAEAIERFAAALPPLDQPALSLSKIAATLGWSRDDVDVVYCWAMSRVRGLLAPCDKGMHRPPPEHDDLQASYVLPAGHACGAEAEADPYPFGKRLRHMLDAAQ
jgi:hypothetical protein